MALSVHIKKKLKNFMLDIDLEAEENCLGLLGMSGCGKSMTLKCIAGIEKPDEGRIVLNDTVLFDSKKRINLRPQSRRTGYLFQNYALFPTMSVRKNIEMALKCKGQEKKEITDRLLTRFHIADFADARPGMISGGQQQRTALARMVASSPEVLLLDEPFSALDSYLKEFMIQEMQDFLREYHKTVILVSHSREEIYQMCDRMAVMNQGTIEAMGDTEEIFLRPGTLQAARITGCKNLSPLEVLDAHHIYAKDWGLQLKVEDCAGAGCTHAGIRAHDLTPIYREVSRGEENVLPCRLLRTTSTPFEQYLIFAPGQSDPDVRERNAQIWWKVSNRAFRQSGKKIPAGFYFPPGKIILLRDKQTG